MLRCPDRPRLLIRGAQVRALHGLPNSNFRRTKVALVNDQSGHAWPAGFLLAYPTLILCGLKYYYQMRISLRILTDGRGLSSQYNYETDSHLEAPLTMSEYGAQVVP